MGSFAFTCGISRLPIEDGDEVRYFLVFESPYADGYWIPRTLPIKAKYNDYGSISSYVEDAVTKNWLEGLKKDLVECSIDDNKYYDCNINKNMSFEQFLKCLNSEFLFVESDIGSFPILDERKKDHRIPSVEKISEIAKSLIKNDKNF